MPIPSPHEGEKEEIFIQRCMSSESMNQEYPDQKQRAGVCYSQFKRKKEITSAPNLIIKSFPEHLKTWKSEEAGIIRRYMEVPVSGVKEDRDGERMSDEALNTMMSQLKSGKIPVFSNHGLDANGMRTYKWQDMIGKWVDAKIENGTLYATMMLNEASPEAVKFWGYAESGMPLGFSIGGKSTDESYEEVDQ